MARLQFALFALIGFVGCATAANETWTVMVENLMTVSMGLDFMDPLTGVVSGSQDLVGPEILRTADGGKTWDNVDHEASAVMYMCMAFTDKSNGVTAGLGLVKPSAAYSTDSGKTWQSSLVEEFEAYYQDCEPVPAVPKMIVMPGSWVTSKESEDGVAISHDSGKTFTHKAWRVNTTARYASFANEKIGWISGGSWPQEPNSLTWRQHSVHVSFVKGKDGSLHHSVDMSMNSKTAMIGDDDEWVGVLAKTTDGGDTWTVQYNETGRLYFNGVYAVDDQYVWAVAENKENSWIFHTTDGGKTWEEQFHRATGSMMTVKFYDRNEGWVAGSVANGLFGSAGMWHTTDGGKTWAETTLDNYFVNDLDLLDKEHVYATAFSVFGGSGVLQYTPSK